MFKKIRPHTVPEDFCQNSFDQLQSAVSQWFDHFVPDHGEVWMPDEEKYNFQEKFPEAQNRSIEVVLTGKFFLRFLEMPCWPWPNFRIWVLSNRVKNILVQLCGLPSECVGVIPREQLVPSDGTPVKSLNSEKLGLVYAGRLSIGKNVEGLLKTVSILQTNYNYDVTLDIFGDFDDMLDDSWGRFSSFSYKEKLQATYDSLVWKNSPTFHGWVPIEKWLHAESPNPTFVSLSTFMSEDFGMAARLAQRAGWPCLLSNWGGHADQVGLNQFLIPIEAIAQTYDSDFVSTEKAKALAQWIYEKQMVPHDALVDGFENPLSISKKEISEYHTDFVKKWQPHIFYAIRNNLALFADTRDGMNFFCRYRALMRSNPFFEELVVVPDDLQFQSSESLHLNASSEVLPVRYLFSKYHLANLNHYKNIRVEGDHNHVKKIKEFLSHICDI